jgi:hypothetical protein
MTNKPLQQFEFPIVPTEFSIKRNLMETFKAYKNVLVFDLGSNVDVFEHFTPRNYIEEQLVRSTTEYLLLQVANAYKWVGDDLLFNMLYDFADKIRKKSLGGVISLEMYNEYIEKAIELKDTIDVEPNTTIRFLTNPFYVKQIGEDINKIKAELINRQLANDNKKDNYDIIEDEICCYDLNQKKLTKKLLAEITGLSYATTKNYLNDYPALNDAYEQVNRLSGTDKQHKNRQYNFNKISKVAKLCA